jgi:hypothetical protein
MTILKVTVEDEQADMLRKLLQEVSFVKNVEEDTTGNDVPVSDESSYHKIKEILNKAKGKNLFADIKDPVEWQRELRKEWDRDF